MDLVLRRWTEDDAPALGRAIAESLDHLRAWMPWAADEPRPEAERRAWIREGQANGENENYGIWLDGVVVGGCGLHRRLGEDALEIGYWVHVAYTRRGIATEAVRRVRAIAFARPGIRFVEIHHHPDNVASGKVAAAAGFALVDEEPDEWRWRSLRPR